jgi:hypothetical protein
MELVTMATIAIVLAVGMVERLIAHCEVVRQELLGVIGHIQLTMRIN